MEILNEETSVRESMDSKFRYVLLVAQRAEQIMRGARPKFDMGTAKATGVAKEEIDRGLIEWDYGPRPEPELEAIGEERAEATPASAAPELAEEEGVH
ncbi:MAG TPA: DNA-directed RNA polymerase subunit omega [Thermoanaerobaculia bacterium]|nr:DNA-directed RNA polymerase subunit omega [Thermoanaerobaculia bacterium]